MSGTYGVIQGYKLNHLERNLELDNRIYERNIPSAPLQPSFSMRPTATKYDYMGIIDRRKPATVPIQTLPIYNIASVFNPGTRTAPFAGFAASIDVDSQLRNQFFALQNCEQSTYVPSSNSDMYRVPLPASSNTLPNQFHHLQRKEEYAYFNPNTYNLARGVFMNHTRQQLKDIDRIAPVKSGFATNTME